MNESTMYILSSIKRFFPHQFSLIETFHFLFFEMYSFYYYKGSESTWAVIEFRWITYMPKANCFWSTLFFNISYSLTTKFEKWVFFLCSARINEGAKRNVNIWHLFNVSKWHVKALNGLLLISIFYPFGMLWTLLEF